MYGPPAGDSNPGHWLVAIQDTTLRSTLGEHNNGAWPSWSKACRTLESTHLSTHAMPLPFNNQGACLTWSMAATAWLGKPHPLSSARKTGGVHEDRVEPLEQAANNQHPQATIWNSHSMW